ARMREENPHLSEAQARHLTEHAARQNEDGSYSWKFDRYARLGGGPDGLTAEQQYHLWRRISCPVLLVRGADSFFPDPSRDGRVGYFRDARLVTLPDAGHWAHHDQLDRFMNAVWGFLDE
ncbi:MAG: tropinesterase, partial [Phenylobacterium sp.]|nr:tropinesterase [Phenylobacterium sp.]